MANNIIGCSSAKTTLIDPNAFDGQDSSTNISVPLEDLTISVELNTRKRARTILTTTQDGLSTSDSQAGVTVNFIGGEKKNETRVLTTAFTDLTTTFNDPNESQNLGITNIDIDFNSSYAPMITINFIDVKGSAIFQNEEKIGDNKYSVFFELPYPLYNLTIKGYYGQPVSYCLHMTKYTSRFNSQTGNFEITASFIGYTYAILSDMLLGFLKAIEYTDLGNSKYKELKTLNPNLLTLDELYVAVSEVNNGVKKILTDDIDAEQLRNGDLAIQKLNNIKFEIGLLGQNIDYNTSLNDYEFIIINNDNQTNSMTNYNTNVTKIIDEYNVISEFKLNASDFTSLNVNHLYRDIRIIDLKNDDPSLQQTFSNVPPNDFDDTITRLLDYVTSNERVSLAEEKKFDIYDNRSLYRKINEARARIEVQTERVKKSLAITLRSELNNRLGFDPTVRNIINVFTTAVEVFLHVLFEVSKEAGTTTNTTRTNELKKVFNQLDNYDYNSIDKPTFYPWPDYRKESDTEGLVEEYLGKYGVLETPTNVTELKFIDDLLKAFLIQANNQAKVDQLLLEEQENWMPINPFDTRLFGVDKFPYQRIEGIIPNELKTLILIRAMTFMGLTNRSLSGEEIDQLAEFEAKGILSDVTSPSIITALANATNFETALLGVKGKVKADLTFYNAEYRDIPVLIKEGNEYRYNYIFDEFDSKILPINGDFYNSEWYINNLPDYPNEGRLFLTNYTQSSGNTKTDDGGKYIGFKNSNDYYEAQVLTLTSVPTNIDKTIDLGELSKTFNEVKNDSTKVGFNPFGGIYGTQEFSVLNYNNDDLEGLPFRYMFYSDTIFTQYNKSNSFAYKRKAGVQSVFDKFDLVGNRYKNDYYPVAKNISDVVYYVDGIMPGYPIAPQFFFDFFAYSTEIDWDYYKYFPTTKDGSVHKEYGKFRNLANIFRDNPKDVTFPYVNFSVYDTKAGGLNISSVSLFGSRLYYEQTTQEAKAFLFLHSLPWNGLTNGKIFDKPEILNTFAHRAGFVSVPYLWAAFIGGLLFRINQGEIIDFYNPTAQQSYIPNFLNDSSEIYPTQRQYLKVKKTDREGYNSTMFFDSQGEYEDIDEVLLTLPQQTKNEFISFFNDFVSSEWLTLKNQLEVINDGLDWVTTYTDATLNLSGLITITGTTNTKIINTSLIESVYNRRYNNILNLDNYIIFTPIEEAGYLYNFALELKDNSPAVNTLIGLINKETIIANASYKIWKSDPASTVSRKDISVKEDDIKRYLSKLSNILSGTTTTNLLKQQEQAIFGTSDENIIKLMLYRTCKNIYDKWIGETSNSNEIIFRCGGRNYVDTELAKKRGESTPKLIDSFRFVTRSFRDIGDELAINPTPVIEYLRDNPNSSFYDTVTNLLSSNNFDFIPLPSFINYRDEKQLSSVFKPFSNYDTDIPTAGPSFVCVYLGQKSKHLDIIKKDNDITYPNDGFDISCNGQTLLGLPKDFNTQASNYEDPVTFFKVNFGQQNQNIFKEITLDQSEFGETAESLQITDDISRKGTETNRTLAGQNLYNVYSVRSYKVEVEMLGDAMIQPMMYFQLNNIPMFHGAYMITHVKHNIKPNHMSTHFTGVRLRKPETQIFDVGDLFMSLLDTLENTNTSQNGATIGSRTTNSPNLDADAIPDPSIANLFGNPYELGNSIAVINSAPGVRTLDGVVQTHKGVDYAATQGTNLLAIADGVVEQVRWQMGESRGFGLYIVINHGKLGDDNNYYKSLYGHVSELDKKIIGKTINELTPEDIQKMVSYDGFKPNTKVVKGQVIGKSGGNAGVNYLQQSPKKYDLAGGSKKAHLHYELRIDTVDKEIFSMKYVNSVPYFPLGATAIYKNGNIPKVNEGTVLGSNADFWSLAAVCSLEAGNPQARADVAQSIFNRLSVPSKPYGKSIKEIIVALNQYEPTFNNKSDWKKINDEETAITAIMKAKNWTYTVARSALKQSNTAIQNETLLKNSRDFIGTRTEFLAEKPTSAEAQGVVERTPVNINNAFFWRYAGIKIKNSPVPLAPNWAALNVDTSMV